MARFSRPPADRDRRGSHRYRSAFRTFVQRKDDQALVKAYEFGRAALRSGRSLPDVITVHTRSVVSVARASPDRRGVERSLKASGAFLAEVLSPYEMAHRGGRDAISALRRWNDALEEEIRQISRVVHDEADELLAAVHVTLADLEEDLPPTAAARMRLLRVGLAQAETRLRELARELHPTVLDDLGCVAAIRTLADVVARRYDLQIRVEGSSVERFSRGIETAVYRLAHEAVTNAAQHAKAAHVVISIEPKPGFLKLEVVDDGVGFSSDSPRTNASHGGLGLTGMRERVDALGRRHLQTLLPDRA